MFSVADILNGDFEEIDDDLNIIQENNETEETPENEEEPSQTEDNKDKPEKKARKRIQRTVLNVERLKGPRGLICIEKFFSNVKFRGSGHEKDDLNHVMMKLQHWCHRMYPKFTFDDTLEQLERLGTKKPVITLKTKIRMNMLGDEVLQDVNSQKDLQTANSPEPSVPETYDFDSLLDRQLSPIREVELPNPSSKVSDELTDEQQEIIARNRLLAAEKRKAKLDAQKNTESLLASHELLIEEMQLELQPENNENLHGNTETEMLDEYVASSKIPQQNSENLLFENCAPEIEIQSNTGTETQEEDHIASLENVIGEIGIETMEE